MLEINARQQAMLKEMGILLPWRATAPVAPAKTGETMRSAETAGQHAHQPKGFVQPSQGASDTAVPPPQSIKQQLSAAPVVKREPVQPTSSETAQAGNEHLIARAGQIATMTLDELETAVRQCNACSLCKSRKQAVFSAGIPTAQWMVVGEAPGEQEDKQGFPFVGPAGQLLDRMLAQLALSRSPVGEQQPVYITNVLKCRPPRNRNPEPAEMAACEHFLKRQIELVQPKIILVVGRFAVQTLLNTHEAIGRLRGQVHRYNGIPAIVTYHPAYLLRNPVDKRKSWADLCLAAQTYTAIMQQSN